MGSPIEVPTDVPDADAAEQAQDVRPGQALNRLPPPIADEADEFDAMEQNIIVEDDEDDYR